MPHDATVQEVLTALDTTERELTDWECDFLESVIRQPYPLTVKQHAVLVKMAEEYCDPLLAAELRGQQRLFP
jgi:hypothetical protein